MYYLVAQAINQDIFLACYETVGTLHYTNGSRTTQRAGALVLFTLQSTLVEKKKKERNSRWVWALGALRTSCSSLILPRNARARDTCFVPGNNAVSRNSSRVLCYWDISYYALDFRTHYSESRHDKHSMLEHTGYDICSNKRRLMRCMLTTQDRKRQQTD